MPHGALSCALACCFARHLRSHRPTLPPAAPPALGRSRSPGCCASDCGAGGPSQRLLLQHMRQAACSGLPAGPVMAWPHVHLTTPGPRPSLATLRLMISLLVERVSWGTPSGSCPGCTTGDCAHPTPCPGSHASRGHDGTLHRASRVSLKGRSWQGLLKLPKRGSTHRVRGLRVLGKI
jgi:hypothetical protein